MLMVDDCLGEVGGNINDKLTQCNACKLKAKYWGVCMFPPRHPCYLVH